MKARFWRGLVGWWWLFIRLPVVLAWHRVYQLAVEGPLAVALPAVPAFSDFPSIISRLKKQAYSNDGPKQLGDATHSARWLHHYWGELTEGIDCDDFAEYGAAMVRSSRHNLGVSDVSICYLCWDKEAHAFVIFRDAEGYKWMDYGAPSRAHATLESIMDEVTRWYARGQHILAWDVRPA